jgi:hypothetical protein
MPAGLADLHKAALGEVTLKGIAGHVTGGHKSKLIPAIAAFDTEHFLKSDDVCIDMLEHIEDSFGTDTAIQPTTLMDVVGCDAQNVMGLFHET